MMTFILCLLAFLLGFFLSRQLYLSRLASMARDVEKLRQDVQEQLDISQAQIIVMRNNNLTVMDLNE